MRLTVDADSDIDEVNDETNGVNNNIEEMTITVSALGVRLVALDSNGMEDSSMVNQTLNPADAEGYTWPVILKHEGTAQQSVKPHLLKFNHRTHSVMMSFFLPRMIGLEVLTFRTFHSISNGSGWNSIYLNITMNNDDADLSGSTDRYAMAGTYVMDLTAKYSNNPESQALNWATLVVEGEGCTGGTSGTSGLEAYQVVTAFSISVRNTGNSPAVYDLDCYSENRWPVELGQSNSSSPSSP